MHKAKFVLKGSVVALLLGLSAMATAQTLDVRAFQLQGEVQNLTGDEQQALADLLVKYQGANKDMASLQEARQKVAELLNSFGKEKYDVQLPQQAINNGTVVLKLLVQVDKSEIIYKGTRGYSEENVANSIPSLKEGKFYEDGRQWFDRREFNMAQENPLKITGMHYDLDPAKKLSNLTVLSYAPNGKHRGYVSVDNYGSSEFDRTRLIAGYVNGNLTGRDDVLMLNALTNFKKPNDSYAFGASYSLPLYDKHQSIGVQLGYSNLDSDRSDSLPVGINKKMVQGKTFIAGLNWSYYLPQFNWGVQDQFKVNAGYSYRQLRQDSNINDGLIQMNDKYGIAGVNLGISGEIKPTVHSVINLELTQYFLGKGIPGSHGTERLKELGYDNKYKLTVFRVGYSQDFLEGWNFNTQLSGQYSPDYLPSLDQTLITGVYGVRGFREGSLSGDKGLVWRNELNTPKYGDIQLNGYAFYDMGKYKLNDINRPDNQGIASSAGFGFRMQPVRNLNTDVFVATRVHNKSFDRKEDGTVMPKWGVWAKMSYSF